MSDLKSSANSNGLLRAFTDHPASVNETYGEHFVFAGRFGLKLIGAGLAACIHGFLPFAFKTTASRTVQEMARKTSVRSAAGANVGTAGPRDRNGPATQNLDWSV